MWNVPATGAAIETIPARAGKMVTPSDSDELNPPTRTLIVGGSGDLAVEFVTGGQVTIPASVVGAMPELPIAVRKVLATGTTATDILALW